jgi:hypothetical protein
VNIDRKRQCVFPYVVLVTNSFHMFNANVLEEGAT